MKKLGSLFFLFLCHSGDYGSKYRHRAKWLIYCVRREAATFTGVTGDVISFSCPGC